MSKSKFRASRKNLTVTISVLVVISILLVVGLRFSRKSTDVVSTISPNVEAAIEKLLSKYQVDEKSIKLRKVPSGDGKFARLERRISVAPEFNTLNFNHELNQAVAEFGAAAIATERSEDKSVNMHIKKDGVIVQSIVFVITKENQ